MWTGFFSISMKFGLALIVLLVVTCVISGIVLADMSVGVKQGDWVEYNVSFTGNPPAEHDAVWARMEIVSVEGNRVNATFASRLANDTMLSVEEDLDFEAGKLIDMFIIPSDLNVGDIFYDKTVGNVTIDGVEVRGYAGATRTVVHAEVLDTEWYWDRASGVTLEARTANPVYTLNTIADNTNLWNPQIFGLDATVFYVLIVFVVVGVIGAAIVLVLRRKKSENQENSKHA